MLKKPKYFWRRESLFGLFCTEKVAIIHDGVQNHHKDLSQYGTKSRYSFFELLSLFFV
jgi:hypothetical protein